MAHGDIHETKSDHADLAAVGVGVQVDQQIDRAPFSDQQIRPVAGDQRRQAGAAALGEVRRHGIGHTDAVASKAAIVVQDEVAFNARRLLGRGA